MAASPWRATMNVNNTLLPDGIHFVALVRTIDKIYKERL